MIPPYKNLHLGFRLFFLFSLFFLCTGVFTYVGYCSIHFLFGVQAPDQVIQGIFTGSGDWNAFMFIQGIGSLGGFALSSIMFSYLEAGEFSNHLRFNHYPKLKVLALAIFSILIAQYFIEFLVKLNSKIPIPSSFGFLKEAEDKADQITNHLLDFKDFGKFIYASVVLAVIPALGEEMFFRGLLLGDLLKAKVRPAVAIVVTGLIFAVFHFEFQNTLAIWALGCFLGYLYYVSGSLWLSISAHFINNFLEVLLKYLYNTKVITEDMTNTSTPIYMTIISVALFIACLFIFNKWKRPYAISEELLQDEQISQ